MRSARIKAEGHGYYHCLSRIVDRRLAMGDEEKEYFRDTMRRTESFCGVRVLTYTVMGNHFHILVEVPVAEAIDEKELLRRLEVLYGQKGAREWASKWAMWRGQGLERLVEADQKRLAARMWDISQFMKTLKQRYTQWHNRRKGRTGTLWEDRFKSVLVEGARAVEQSALATMAAYIDLNSVRAGLVADPKDYRWCGYAEAVAGRERAREGLAVAMGEEAGKGTWSRVGREYRQYVYASGELRVEMEDGRERVVRSGFRAEQVEGVLTAGGKLSRYELLRCRVRYFSDGVALGSKAFVNGVWEKNRGNFGVKRKSGARGMRGGDWGGLCTARALRLAPISVPAGPG